MEKVVFKLIETPAMGCDCCGRSWDEVNDPYFVTIGNHEYTLCDACAIGVRRILLSAGVEVEAPDFDRPVSVPSPSKTWKV